MSDLSDAAKAVYAAHPEGRGESMTSALVRRIRADEALLKAALEHVAAELLRDAERALRAVVMGGPSPQKFPQELRDLIVRRNRRLLFLEMMIPLKKGSVRLGSASSSQLEEAIAVYMRNVKGNQRRADFLTAVARKVKGTLVVEQVWTEKALGNLKKRIDGDNAA